MIKAVVALLAKVKDRVTVPGPGAPDGGDPVTGICNRACWQTEVAVMMAGPETIAVNVEVTCPETLVLPDVFDSVPPVAEKVTSLSSIAEPLFLVTVAVIEAGDA